MASGSEQPKRSAEIVVVGDNHGERDDPQTSRREQEQDDHEQPLEAGFVSPLEEVDYHPQKHRAETTKRLALLFVRVLAFSGLLHYLAIAILGAYGKDKAVETLQATFNIWLPVMSGLVGAAASFYFAQEK